MPTPLKAFILIFVLLSLFGLMVGTLNLMNPQAVHIPFGPNGESAEGLDGLIAALASSMMLGLIFGGFVALLTWLTGSGVKSARKSLYPEDETSEGEGS